MPTLPIPDDDAQKHSRRLCERIMQEIKEKGPISFYRYMSLALYCPGLGYYSAGSQKFGREGDFITAPEISTLFAKTLANSCAEVLEKVSQGDILELGPGSGALALKILHALKEIGPLPGRYFLLEVSAELKDRQQRLLKTEAPELFDRIVWLDRLPIGFRGVIIANEVMDAMPIHRFKQLDSLQEIYVNFKNGSWVEECHEPIPLLQERVAALGVPLARGYESEINLYLPAWIASLGDSVSKGVILLIDYGFPQHEYYHPERKQGTLMCHYRHWAHTNPYFYPGLQDITAHVDFTAVAKAAEQVGLNIIGFTNQAAFLLNAGITELMTSPENIIDYYQEAQEVKKLTLPSEMGELFKVMALAKGDFKELLGFGSLDQRQRLEKF